MDTDDAAKEPRTTVADLAATAALPTLPPLRTATFPYHPGDIILPGYRLTKRLGSGGFGEVWRAEAPGGLGVAIKILANLGRREGGANTGPCRRSKTSVTRTSCRCSACG